MGVFDDKKEELKKKIQKAIRKAVMSVLKIIGPILLVAIMFFVIVLSIKGVMVQLLNSAQTAVSNFWTWITDDYWIKLDEKNQYDDGEYTIVERYIKDLASQGISLKELRLLGDFNFSEEDQKLTEEELIEKIIENENNEYSEQKELIEKYITEFIRADFITQSLHRRKGVDVVSSSNEDWVDGGIYLYRAKNSSGNIDTTSISEGMVVREIDGIEYVVMEYESPEKFQEKLNNNDEKLRYKYTIDPDTGELIYVQVKTTQVISGDISNVFGNWFTDLSQWIFEKTGTNKTVELTEVRVDYKQYVSKYTMPYEFLVNLCMITQNPEFVYHVAMLARDTKISLAIHDNETIEEVTVETEKKYVNYKNTEDNTVSGATETVSSTPKTREVTITTTMNASILETRYVNAWSYYEEFEYTKTQTTVTEPTTPQVTEGPVDTKDTLSGHYEGGTMSEIEQNDMGRVDEEYWYENDYLKEHRISTQTTITTNTYKIPEKAKNSVHKSKQFLGLLRNETGECPYNCYSSTNTQLWQFAKQCVREAVFDREGINVSYQIPNRGVTETPLDKLLSGEDMLYQLLGVYSTDSIEEESGEYSVDESVKTEAEMNSIYNQKMQKLIEHFQYLMTFPENEEYIVINDQLIYAPEDTEIGGSVDISNLSDIIVKTDVEGAAPKVTKEELITIINSAYSGKKKTNALSLVDTLMDGQQNNHVNPVFMLAVAQIETSMGTANTEYVNKHNNWTSWNLGNEYSSGADNIKTAINGIANGSNYFTQGKYTIKEIGYTYCPNMPEYPNQGDKWVKSVTSTVRKLYSCIGTAISTDTGAIGGYYTSTNGKTYTIYYQNDYPNTPYWGSTVAKVGCSVTADCIVLSGYGVDKNPAELLNGRTQIRVETELQNNGLSVTRKTYSEDLKEEIKENLDGGRPVIIYVNGTSSYTNSEHWMALLDINAENQVYVANPNRNGSQGWTSIDHVLTGCEEIIIINE